MKYLLLFMLLSGCATTRLPDLADYEAARYAAIDAWERVVGPVPRRCRLLTGEYSVIEVVEIQRCGEELPDYSFWGCVHHYSQIIEIATANRTALEKMDIAVHEYVHVLRRCVCGGTDSHHKDNRLWGEYGGRTVEAVGCAELKR
jgi:hypothetical protein